jgi:hypothetical protein
VGGVKFSGVIGGDQNRIEMMIPEHDLIRLGKLIPQAYEILLREGFRRAKLAQKKSNPHQLDWMVDTDV